MRLPLAVLTLFTGAAFGATPWAFEKVRVLSELTDANIETEVYNLAGGTVDLLVSGRPYGLCPGGFERLRFIWRFDKDISRLSPGERFGARLEIRKAGSTPPCTSAIADRAYLAMYGSAGAVTPWPDNERGVLDSNRFQSYRGDRANIDRTADDIVELASASYAVDPQRPNGWFQISLSTTAGTLRYCYIYRPDASGGATPPPSPPIPNPPPDSPGPVPSIGGTWYREGDPNRPATVEQSGAALVFTNEFGNRSSGRFDGAGVIAVDWYNLRGRLVNGNTKIEWGNGSSWSRPGGVVGVTPSIGGTWYREGDPNRPATVEQSGAALAFTNEFGNRSSGRFDGADVIAVDWYNLRGRLTNGNTKIEWGNGSSWSRDSGTGGGAAPSLGGTWYREGDPGRPATVEQSGTSVVFTNEFGTRSRGRFDGADVIAVDWNNLRGRLVNGNTKIEWGNGSSWSRGGGMGGGATPSLGGTWYREGDVGRPAKVEQSGTALVFTNEFGTRSRGRFDGADVIAVEWNNLRGRLVNGNTTIEWGNGSTWSRRSGAGGVPPAGGYSSTWRSVGVGDCPGRDVATSSGPNPDEMKCDAAFSGYTAVCWGGSCTYKNLPTAACTGGANPGRMFTCEAGGVLTTRPPATIRQPAGGSSSTWRSVGVGDCPGRDVANSSGPNPDELKCNTAFSGFTAVCWGGSCTYKNLPTAACTGGANPGRMFTCEAGGARLGR